MPKHTTTRTTPETMGWLANTRAVVTAAVGSRKSALAMKNATTAEAACRATLRTWRRNAMAAATATWLKPVVVPTNSVAPESRNTMRYTVAATGCQIKDGHAPAPRTSVSHESSTEASPVTYCRWQPYVGDTHKTGPSQQSWNIVTNECASQHGLRWEHAQMAGDGGQQVRGQHVSQNCPSYPRARQRNTKGARTGDSRMVVRRGSIRSAVNDSPYSASTTPAPTAGANFDTVMLRLNSNLHAQEAPLVSMELRRPAPMRTPDAEPGSFFCFMYAEPVDYVNNYVNLKPFKEVAQLTETMEAAFRMAAGPPFQLYVCIANQRNFGTVPVRASILRVPPM
jgi:hypothetical protein